MNKILTWLKRPQTWGFFVATAVMALIALAFFYPDNIDGASLHQADMAQGMANGQEGKAFAEATGQKALWTNSLFSGMPTFQISPSYSSNSLFKWIDKLYGLFLPEPSNLLFMMMMGFLILLYCLGIRWWIALIGAIAWGFSSYYIIIIGAGHIWKFITLAYIPPTIGGLILCYRGRYMLGGALTAVFAMMQLNANHPQMTYYFAFVMLGFAIVCLIELKKAGKLKQWGIASGVAVLAGCLAFGANLPSLYNTYEYAKETKRSQSELTPIQSANQAPQERPTGGLPKGEIVGWSYGGAEMFSLLVPNVKGGGSAKPIGGQMHALTLAQLESARDVPYETGQLLQYFSQYFNDSEGTNGPVYVGAIICALFLLGCIIVRGPIKWMLLILTVLSMLLALGRNFSALTDFMIYYFPMYNKFRAVESILVIAEFTMPLLAILALARVLTPAGTPAYVVALPEQQDEKADNAKLQQKMLYAFGFCVFICALFAAAPKLLGNTLTHNDMAIIQQIQGSYPDYPVMPLVSTISSLRYGMIKADAMRSLFFLVLGAAVLWAFLRNKGKGFSVRNHYAALAGAAIAILVVFDLFQVDKRYLSHESFVPAQLARLDGDLPAELKADAIDQTILKDTDLSYRVMDIPGFGSAARSYWHKMIGGYHAAKLNRYEDLINRRMSAVRGYGYIPELREDSVAEILSKQSPDVVTNLIADYHVLDMLNARYIITGDEENPLVYNPDALGNAWLVSGIEYVDNADQEMAALASLDPRTQAVADKKFMSALGQDVVAPNPADAITLTKYTPNTLTYESNTANDAIGVFSEVYFPWGWKATIDGQPAQIGRVNYVLRAMRIPAGHHQIVMTFDPASIRVSVSIAYVCVTLIYMWLLLSLALPWFRKK